MADYSLGLPRLFQALGGTNTTLAAQRIAGQAAQQDAYAANAQLTREKIKAAVAENAARDPKTWDDLLASGTGASPQAASSFRRNVTGDPWRLPADAPNYAVGEEGPLNVNVKPEITPDAERALGRLYAALRGSQVAGGNIAAVTNAAGDLQKSDLRGEAAGIARDPSRPASALNRLISAMEGKAYEPYASGTFGPYSQETGDLRRPEVFDTAAQENRAQAGASNALAGQRGAATRQTNVETANLERAGMKEPGRGRSGTGKGSVFDQKYERYLTLYPGDEKGALEYAGGRKRTSYAEARKMASTEAKAKGLTGSDFDAYVTSSSEEIMAQERGDKADVRRVQLRNATTEITGQKTRLAKLKGAKRDAEIARMAVDLARKGFEPEEVKAILYNAGVRGEGEQ